MFTGSAVRVQAVQDLKLQQGQEIGRRSWKSGRHHPQSPAEARRREGREQEVEAGGSGRKKAGGGQRKEDSRRKIPEKPPRSQKRLFTSFLSFSLFFPDPLTPAFAHFSFVMPLHFHLPFFYPNFFFLFLLHPTFLSLAPSVSMSETVYLLQS
jgi:hypothetical protein